MSAFTEIAEALLSQRPVGCAWQVKCDLEAVERLLDSGCAEHTELRQALDALDISRFAATLDVISSAHKRWLLDVHDFVEAVRIHELP